MNKFRIIFIALICWCSTIYGANAHVTMVYPTGGEIFLPGSEIEIQWLRTVRHMQLDWDVYYSSDGGATWQPIALNLPDDINTDQFSYIWTVPKITTPTMSGRFRVVQDNTGLDYEGRTFIFTIEAVPVNIDFSEELPAVAELMTAYPNPFFASTKIEFKMPRSERVRLEIFDTQGKKVAVLLDRNLSSGVHRATWSAGELPSGLYFFRLTAGNAVENRKIILLR